jgi:hypothetical protein
MLSNCHVFFCKYIGLQSTVHSHKFFHHHACQGNTYWPLGVSFNGWSIKKVLMDACILVEGCLPENYLVTTKCFNPMFFVVKMPCGNEELKSLVGRSRNARYFASQFLLAKWVGWRTNVIARIMIFSLMLHSICS